MNGKTHALVGTTCAAKAAIACWSVGSIFGLPVIPWVMILSGAAGSLKSDIDMEGNPENRSASIPMWIVRHMPFLKKFFAHRGITHACLIPALVYILSYSVSESGTGNVIKFIVSILIGWFIGYCSHISVDTLNGKGTPILWPVYWKRVHLMSINSDTYEEAIFVLLWVVLIVADTVLRFKGIYL